MAVFGSPVVHEDDALRAVRAASEIQAAVRDLGIQARIGVNTGEVVAQAGHPMVTGDAVNVAARLEQLAPPGEVLIGDATYQLVRGAIAAEPVEGLAARGKRDPVKAWRLRSVSNATSGFIRRLDTPLVGRVGELRLMRDALSRVARERRCHLFTLLGPPGVGKSRLVSELARSAGGEALALVGQCLPYGDGITYWPVAEILRAAANMDDADDRSTARSRLEHLVEADPEAPVVADRLASAIGLGGTPAPSAEIQWALRRTLERLGQVRPLIVAFEDVNWAEPSLLDLIDYLAGSCRGSAILMVCTARPELVTLQPGWAGGKLDATTILLEPLQDAECDLLITTLAQGLRLTPKQRSRVIEAAEGNPLFVEQMLAMLARPGARDVEVPATITALLAARLEQLTQQERDVLECASVEGRVFHRSAVEALAAPEARPAVAALLEHLVQRELIDGDASLFAGDEGFRFRHLLIRDAVYGSVPKRLRSDYHERFAGWLGAAAGDRLDEYEEIFAYHLGEAVRYRRELEDSGTTTGVLAERAARAYRRAADRAAVRGDFLAGASMLAQVGKLLPPSDARVALALVDRAHWLRWSRPEQAAAAAREAVEAAEHGGDAAGTMVRIFERFVRLNIDPDIAVADLVDAARAEAERLDTVDAGAAARLWWIVANVAETYLHRSSLAVAAAARSRQLAADAGAEWLASDATGMLIQSTTHGPGPIDELLEAGEELLSGAGGLGRAMYLDIRALLLAQRGDLDDALEALDQAAAIWTEFGITTWAKYGPSWLRGSVFLLAGRPHDAVAPLRDAVELATISGEDSYASTIRGLLARALALIGETVSALEEAERARGLTRPGDTLSQLLWRGAEVRALAALGRHAEAEARSAELIALIGRVEVPELRFDALADAAEGKRAAGNLEEARALLGQALDESVARGARSLATQATTALGALDAVPASARR
jgi:tetratricopeptide (TPR) repeat protein